MTTFKDSPQGPTVEGASPQSLRALLEELATTLAAVGVPLTSLRRGLARDAVIDRLTAAGLGAPEEVIEWFGWNDGQDVSAGQPLALPGPALAGLDDAITRQAHLLAADRPEFFPGLSQEERLWGVAPGWLRLVDDNTGLAVDCGGDPTQPPRIRFASAEFALRPANQTQQALSLCTLVAWWLYGIRGGGYTFDAGRGEWLTDVTRLEPSQFATGFV